MYSLTVGLILVNTSMIFSQVIVFDFYSWKITSWSLLSNIIWTTLMKQYKPHANKMYHHYYQNYHGCRSLYLLWMRSNLGRWSRKLQCMWKMATLSLFYGDNTRNLYCSKSRARGAKELGTQRLYTPASTITEMVICIYIYLSRKCYLYIYLSCTCI